MKHLHVIMPMAGEGSRFKNGKFTLPKPLIEYNGKSFFRRSLDSIRNFSLPIIYTFIVRDEHIKDFEIDKIILASYPNANILNVKQTTRGAVETVMLAHELINKEQCILIMDCDLEFESNEFINTISSIVSQKNTHIDGGVLLSFESIENKYSYAQINKKNMVIQTAEKEPISNNALVGAYFFSNGEIFKKAARTLLQEKYFNKPEFYVSLLYNYIIEMGHTVILTRIDNYSSFGTPQELDLLK